MPRINQTRLREFLTELGIAFTEPREAEISIPDQFMAQLAGKRIAMVGFAAEEAERLCAIFEYIGALPRLFEN